MAAVLMAMRVPTISALFIESTFSLRLASRLSLALARNCATSYSSRPKACTILIELNPSCATVSTALSLSAIVVDSVADALGEEKHHAAP